MKKIIILFALFLSLINIAGTREDFIAARDNFERTNDVETYQKDLKKIIANKPDFFTRLSKLNLAILEFDNKDNVEGTKKKLKEIIEDKELEKPLLMSAYINLYEIEEDFNYRISILDKLIELDPDEILHKIQKIIEYTLAGKEKVADEEYAKLIHGLNDLEVLYLDEILALKYEELKLDKEIDKILERVSKKKGYKAVKLANNIRAKKALSKGDYDEALKYAKANIRYDTNDALELVLVESIYKSKNDKMGYLEYMYDYLMKYNKGDDLTFVIIGLAEELGRADISDKLIKETKKLPNNFLKKNLNFAIGDYAISKKMDPKIIIKYGLKAIEEDKDYRGYELVAIGNLEMGNKEEALKAVEKAIEARTQNAMALKYIILNSK